jgi:hypothetical protein
MSRLIRSLISIFEFVLGGTKVLYFRSTLG